MLEFIIFLTCYQHISYPTPSVMGLIVILQLRGLWYDVFGWQERVSVVTYQMNRRDKPSVFVVMHELHACHQSYETPCESISFQNVSNLENTLQNQNCLLDSHTFFLLAKIVKYASCVVITELNPKDVSSASLIFVVDHYFGISEETFFLSKAGKCNLLVRGNGVKFVTWPGRVY